MIILAIVTFSAFSALAENDMPVTKELMSHDYQTRFVGQICGIKNLKKATKKQKEECDSKYLETFNAKLIDTYPGIDWKLVGNWCKANPFDCPNDWIKLEAHVQKLSLENYETALAKANERDQETLAAKSAQDQQNEMLKRQADATDRMARIQAASAIMGASAFRPATAYQMPINHAVNCTTQSRFGTSYTNCN